MCVCGNWQHFNLLYTPSIWTSTPQDEKTTKQLCHKQITPYGSKPNKTP